MSWSVKDTQWTSLDNLSNQVIHSYLPTPPPFCAPSTAAVGPVSPCMGGACVRCCAVHVMVCEVATRNELYVH